MNCCLCLFLLTTTAVVAHEVVDAGRRNLLARRDDFKPCGTDESELEDFARRSLRALQVSGDFEGVTLPVWFHVGYQDSDGVGRKNWFDDRVAAEKALLRTIDNANAILSGEDGSRGPHADTKIRLCWGGVKFYEGYEYTCPHSTARGNWMRSTTDPEFDRTKVVNVFVCNLGLSGGVVYTMPDRQRETHLDHGYFLHYKTLNNWMCDVNENHCSGDSMAHELGHFLGLWHPWNGGCTSYTNDFVQDTPMTKRFYMGACKLRSKDKALLGMVYSGNNGKFTWQVINSCTGRSGNDDISNIMDYGYDSCRDHFTEGQIARMHDQMMRYKPTLYANTKTGTYPQCNARPDGTGGGQGPDETESPVTKSPTNGQTSRPTKRPTKAPTKRPTEKPTTTSQGGNSPVACVTTGGWDTEGTACVFPFTFAGGVFNECPPAAVHKPFWGTNKPPPSPPAGADDTYWCATTATYSASNTALRKKWGYCTASCPRPKSDGEDPIDDPIDDPVDDPADDPIGIPTDDPISDPATSSPTYSKSCADFNTYGLSSRKYWCNKRPDCKLSGNKCQSKSQQAPTAQPTPDPTVASTSCLVKKGGYANAGSKCIFPFTYQAKNGKKTVFNECPTVGQKAPWGKNNKKLKGKDLWCSTVKTYKVKYRSKRWGLCGDQPACGAPVATLPPLGCSTDGGWLDKGTPCKFPFTYNGKIHNGCASVAQHRPYWGSRTSFGTPKTPTSPSATKDYWCSKIGKYSATDVNKQKKWGFCDCGGSLSASGFQSLASKGTWEIDETEAPTSVATEDGGGGGGGTAAIVGGIVGCLVVAGVVAAVFVARRRNAKRAYNDLEADKAVDLGSRPSKRRVSVTRREGLQECDAAAVSASRPSYLTRLKRFLTPETLKGSFRFRTSGEIDGLVVEKADSATGNAVEAPPTIAATVVTEDADEAKGKVSLKISTCDSPSSRRGESQLSPQ